MRQMVDVMTMTHNAMMSTNQWTKCGNHVITKPVLYLISIYVAVFCSCQLVLHNYIYKTCYCCRNILTMHSMKAIVLMVYASSGRMQFRCCSLYLTLPVYQYQYSVRIQLQGSATLQSITVSDFVLLWFTWNFSH